MINTPHILRATIQLPLSWALKSQFYDRAARCEYLLFMRQDQDIYQILL